MLQYRFDYNMLYIGDGNDELSLSFDENGIAYINCGNFEDAIAGACGFGYCRDSDLQRDFANHPTEFVSLGPITVAAYVKRIATGDMVVVAINPGSGWRQAATVAEYGDMVSMDVYGENDEIYDIYDIHFGDYIVERS